MFKIRILKKSDDRSSFSCGDIELDYYFQKFAGQNQFKHFIGTTYIATDEKIIYGFITVSAGALARDNLNQNIQKKYPKYPLPILHITRIGVDIKYQNQGIGKELMATAFKLALEQKDKIGCIGVVVDAKMKAIDFYKKLGFIPLEVKKGIRNNKIIPMFLAVKTIEEAMK